MREFTTHRTTDRHNVNLRTLRRYVHLESFGPSILLWRSKSSINSWDIDACHSIFMNEYVSLCQFIDLPETLQSCRKIIFRSFFFIEDSYCAYVQKNKLSIILTINSLKIAILVLWWWWPPQGDGPSSSFQKFYLTRNVSLQNRLQQNLVVSLYGRKPGLLTVCVNPGLSISAIISAMT